MNEEALYKLIYQWMGIDRKHLRIMSGYKEIYPTDQAYYWKQEELIITKLRILGGGRDMNVTQNENWSW